MSAKQHSTYCERMAKTPQSTGIYCRLSYLDDGTEERVDRQEADCRQLGDRLAWPISEKHIFKDPGRSAWQRNRKRPGWDAMLRAIEAGEIDSVIVYHGDRLLRQPHDLEKLISIADSKGIRIASVTGTRNLDSPDDRYILRIEAAGFCRASDDSSRRIRRASDARAAKGLPRPGGTRAFGFERDNTTIRREEAEVIETAAERLLAGQTMYSVVRWANTVSTTSTGRRWRVNVFKDMITRPRIAGLIERDGVLVEAVWKPILPRETWEDVRSLLAERGKANGLYSPPVGESAVRYLLSGIARCGTSGCGSAMLVQVGTHKGGAKRRTYLCSSTGCEYRVGRSVEPLDAYVVGRVLHVLNDPDFIAGLYADGGGTGVAAEISALERRKAETKEQLENLADYPEIDAAMVAKSLASFDRRITELRAQRAATARQRLLARMAGMTREQWEAEPLDVQRATVAALFKVTVLRARRKGSGFDPESVDLVPVED